MTVTPPVRSNRTELMAIDYAFPSSSQEQAEQANQAFDDAVRQYLHDWIENSTVHDTEKSPDSEHDAEEFIEHGALRTFFKHYDDALEMLLERNEIARHLLRPGNEVFFEPDAYEPLLAKFERRIYNLAAHREHLEISFRYSPTSRQGTYGDSVGLADMPPGEAKEDIGLYFGTRRSDPTALNILGDQLRREASRSTALPLHVITEGYMEESLRDIKQATEHLRDAGDERLHCFVVQRRHAVDDRHLGAALLLMNPGRPDEPQRIIFCDTLNPDGRPPWWNKFKRYVDTVFPRPEGDTPVSERVEDGGVKLQRLHDGVPIRHQDIDCAFYTASIAHALIRMALQSPELILHGSIDAVVGQMTGWMPEYFEQANASKAPEVVRQVNVLRRWETGRQVLANIRQAYAHKLAERALSSPPSELVNSSALA